MFFSNLDNLLKELLIYGTSRVPLAVIYGRGAAAARTERSYPFIRKRLNTSPRTSFSDE